MIIRKLNAIDKELENYEYIDSESDSELNGSQNNFKLLKQQLGCRVPIMTKI